MAKSKQAKSAAPYVQRLLEDEYVQQQLRTAAARLREAYGRASRKRGKAAEDKKLYDNLRDAVTSTRRSFRPRRFGSGCRRCSARAALRVEVTASRRLS